MIVTEKVTIKLAPNNSRHWLDRGYDVGKVGGRGGMNTGRQIEVLVSDLLPGSNVTVECRCDSCGTVYFQRVCRDTSTCVRCRPRRRGSGRTGKGKPAPDRDELMTILRDRGKRAACKRYGTSYPVVNRWIVELGLEGVERDLFPVPADFREWYEERRPSKREIHEKYGVHNAISTRWIKKLGLKFVGVTTKKNLPSIEVLVEMNKTMDTLQMARELGCTTTPIIKKFAENGVSLKKHRAGTSKQEGEVFDFLFSLDSGFVRSKKSVLENGYYEIDCYHPGRRIGFEFDGIFWHSSANGSRPNYHRTKMEMAERSSIDLYRIISTEWESRPDLVKSMLAARLGISTRIGARKTTVEEISSPRAREFHEANHISGGSNFSYSLGLFDENRRLVSVMSMARSRYDGGCEWEIVRYSTLMGHTVVGGTSRLFSAFVRERDPASVLTFSDLRWGRGRSYEKVGFKKVGRTQPTFWYYSIKDPSVRFSRQAFQKKKISKYLTTFDPDKSELQNAHDNGFVRYWDCGSDRFEWKRDKKIPPRD